MLTAIQTSVEIISAIMCFLLVWFMIKPFQITGENKYLGLHLGFGFLGVTYVISAIVYYIPEVFGRSTEHIQLLYIQLIARTVAVLFLALTYYFSKKTAEHSKQLRRIGFTLLIVVSIASLLILSIRDVTIYGYRINSIYIRVLNILIILYICIHTFRSHMEKPDPTTLLVPIGYVFLAVNQYSILLFQLDGSLYPFYAALILRLIFLSILLTVSFKVFWKHKEG